MKQASVEGKRCTFFSRDHLCASVHVKPAYDLAFSEGRSIDILLSIADLRDRIELHIFPEVNADRKVNCRKDLMALYNTLPKLKKTDLVHMSEVQKFDVRIWANRNRELREHESIKEMLEDKRTKFMLQGRIDYGDTVKLALFAFFKGKNGACKESAEVRIMISPSLSEQRRDREQ
jgi:hypothetical protein